MSHPVLTSVLVDVHEPDWIKALTFGGIRSATDACPHLEIGDVWAGCSDETLVVIERKTPTDLISTIKSGRLTPECVAMLTVSSYAYLVVTGTLYENENGRAVTNWGATDFRWVSWQGAALALQQLGIGVVHFWHKADFEQAVMWLAKRQRDPAHVMAPLKHAMSLTLSETILASLPGIGLELAPRLLAHFGTAAAAIAWLTDLDSAEIFPGVAEGKKRAICAAMGLPATDEHERTEP